MAEKVPPEEIRFAVVLNGGVSLAVWMGGAVLEIDRLTRGEGPYGDLLALVGATARADVISGTSAGGINGAALALSQVNELANLRKLRDLWADRGDIDELMRRPFQGSPVSLLRGDEYFLPQLRAAFQRLVSQYSPRPPEQRPVDLTITTTLLHGARTEHVDALGQKLPQSLHSGRFRFRYDSAHSVPPGESPSTDFDDEHINLTVARMALAARSTASFPMAFEPSYVPVRGGTPTPGRPDMHAVASWADLESPDRSRFAVDGGLLANTPTREALEAVDRMPADGPVRRVMLLVYPHASASLPDEPDRPDEMPTLFDTSALLLGALSSQGSRTFVEEIERHNRAAASRRTGRSDLLSDFSDDLESLYETAHLLYPLYKRLRVRRAARDLAARVPPADDWSYERTRLCAERAQIAELEDLPYLPDRPPVESAEEIGRDGTGWKWGISTAEHLAESALDLVARLDWAVSEEGRALLSGKRTALFDARLEVRQLRDRIDRPWTTEPELKAWKPTEGYWRARLARYRQEMLPPAGEVGELVREQALAISGTVAEMLDLLTGMPEQHVELGGLKSWRDLLTKPSAADENADDQTRVLARLLALEVLTTCLAEETETGMSQPVELVQISLMTSSPFAEHTATPQDKGAGLALSRFAGFLKKSWRINDWIWGRLDASATLCRILLNPERMRRIAVLKGDLPGRTPESIATEVVAAVVKTFGDNPLPEEIERLRQRAITELVPVYREHLSTDGLPTKLHALSDLAIWSVQARIAAEELPVLAKAAREDEHNGGNPRARGVQFANVNKTLLDSLSDAKQEAQRVALGLQALDAFDQAGIGQEALGEEAASDRLIRTTVQAASVAVTVMDSGRSGLPVLKPVTRALRGGALLPYWAIRGVTSGGTVAKFLALLGFSLGGLLLVLALLGALPGWATAPAAAAGAGTLLGTFAYGAVRTGTFLHSIVLLAPAVPLVVYAITAVADTGTKTTRGASVVLLMALVVVLLIILGSLPAFPSSPIAVADRLIASIQKGRRRILYALGILILLGGLAWMTINWIAPPVAAWIATMSGTERMIWTAGTIAVLLIVMTAVATLLSRRLRAWSETEDGPTLVFGVHPAASAAGWSIVYASVFLVIAVVLVRWGRAESWRATEPWVVASIVTAAVFAAGLLLFAPWFMPWYACRRITRDVIAEATRELYPAGADQEQERKDIEKRLVDRLRFTGHTYRFLLCTTEKELALTPAGHRLSQQIEQKLALPPTRTPTRP